MKGSWRYGSDKGSVTHGHTDGRTDGRTYTEGRTIYVSRRGRHIIISHINVINRCIKLPFLNRSLEIPLFTDQNASVIRYLINNSFHKLVFQIYLLLQF